MDGAILMRITGDILKQDLNISSLGHRTEILKRRDQVSKLQLPMVVREKCEGEAEKATRHALLLTTLGGSTAGGGSRGEREIGEGGAEQSGAQSGAQSVHSQSSSLLSALTSNATLIGREASDILDAAAAQWSISYSDLKLGLIDYLLLVFICQ